MEGTPLFTGRLLDVREGPGGAVGRVSVRGAQVDVVLDLVPGARVGDDVLVQAGVALTIVKDRAADDAAG